MSSIASGMNAERTNRWLLIGAAVLAVAAGLLVFLLLANIGGDDDASTPGGENVSVLVANRTISANTKITSDMVEAQTVPLDAAVVDYASESSTVVGRVTTSEIIEGQQISQAQLSGFNEDVEDLGLAQVLDDGKVAFALSASEISNVAGFVQAGDRVNVVGVFPVDVKSEVGDSDTFTFTRVATLLQNLEVVAVAQSTVDAVPPVTDDAGAPVDPSAPNYVRPDEVEPNPDAASVTVHISLEQAQILAAARAEGEIFMELRALGDEAETPVEPICFDKFGRFACPPVVDTPGGVRRF